MPNEKRNKSLEWGGARRFTGSDQDIQIKQTTSGVKLSGLLGGTYYSTPLFKNDEIFNVRNASGKEVITIVPGTESVKITGSLGIGTITPISVFEIEDGFTTTGAVLTLGTKEPTVVANDVLGRINFYAPLETGTDAIAVASSIVAVAQDTFAADNNSTALQFQTGKSEVATTKMTIDEDGNVGIGTPDPDQKLHIHGAAGNRDELVITKAGDGVAGILIRGRGNTGYLKIAHTDSGGDSGGQEWQLSSAISSEMFQIVDNTNSSLVPFKIEPSTPTNTLYLDSGGHVGIGTAAPANIDGTGLDVKGSSHATIVIRTTTANTNDAQLKFYDTTTLKWNIHNDGGLSHILKVQNNSGDYIYCPQGVFTEWTQDSDIALKEDIRVLPDALSKVNQIRGVNFKWKKYAPGSPNPNPDDISSSEWESMKTENYVDTVGVIAQDIENVLPEAVYKLQEGRWGVAYTLVVPLLIEAIKELSTKLDTMQTEINNLKSE